MSGSDNIYGDINALRKRIGDLVDEVAELNKRLTATCRCLVVYAVWVGDMWYDLLR